jgi:polar amino acid transport system substrate-binding protein
MFRVTFSAVVVSFVTGCDFPRDPNGTLQRVRAGTLRAGVVHAPPWGSVNKDRAAGVDVELVKLLACELGATVQWSPGGQAPLMKALEFGELDLVVGGLTRDVGGGDRVALSRTFFETRVIVGAPSDQLPVNSIAGRGVAVWPGDVVTAALVRRRGGMPSETIDPSAAGMLVAGEAWRIHALGLTSGNLTLLKREQVFAAPPGENGWLVQVDCFLHSRQADVPALLQAELNR